jgi:hypothetical protein
VLDDTTHNIEVAVADRPFDASAAADPPFRGLTDPEAKTSSRIWVITCRTM